MKFDNAGKSMARFRRWVTIILILFFIALCTSGLLTLWLVIDALRQLPQ